jgi:putative membrane protein
MNTIFRASLVLAVSSLVAVTTGAAAPVVSTRSIANPGTVDLAKAALNDPTIVAIFDAANTADIETGDLAARLGGSKEVRDFGAMLSRDHKQVRQLDRDLAKKLGVTPTPPKPDQGAIDHAAAMKQLRSLKGKAFDHAFLQHEVAFHAAVIDAVQKTLVPAIQNAELKELVLKVAPAFQGHMIAAQTLDKKLFPAADAAHPGM